MKIKLIGTGSISANSMSACALVDGTILVDCPNGVTKRLQQGGVKIEEVGLVLITHFHGDHDFDMPFLLWKRRLANKLNTNPKFKPTPLIIIAPKGAAARYAEMAKLTGISNQYEETPEPSFVEVESKHYKGIEFDKYKITPYKMKHGELECYGYTITRGGKTVGFSGDTALCEGVESLIKSSAVAIVDVATPTPEGEEAKHMYLPELEDLKSRFADCKIMPTHMTDDTRKQLKKKGHKPPNDNMEFKI